MDTISILLPIFFLIALGYGLKRGNFPKEPFWSSLEQLAYYVLFPALLMTSLTATPLRSLTVLPMVSALISGVFAITFLLLLLKPFLPISGASFTSAFQGSLRFNAFIGLAILNALDFKSGIALAALAMAVLVPLLNILSVLILTVFADNKKVSIKHILFSLLRNPLIVTCLVGITINLLELKIPAPFQNTLILLEKSSLPLGLLVVGAGLQLSAIKDGLIGIFIATSVKLALFPAAVWFFCGWFGADAPATFVAVLFTALPTAASSFILARQMGGDAVLMANILTVQTAVAMGSLPFLLSLLQIGRNTYV
jgi:malonate transporter and related proteins